MATQSQRRGLIWAGFTHSPSGGPQCAALLTFVNSGDLGTKKTHKKINKQNPKQTKKTQQTNKKKITKKPKQQQTKHAHQKKHNHQTKPTNQQKSKKQQLKKDFTKQRRNTLCEEYIFRMLWNKTGGHGEN